jgi:endonuclease YncB( thermonuclease family)
MHVRKVLLLAGVSILMATAAGGLALYAPREPSGDVASIQPIPPLALTSAAPPMLPPTAVDAPTPDVAAAVPLPPVPPAPTPPSSAGDALAPDAAAVEPLPPILPAPAPPPTAGDALAPDVAPVQPSPPAVTLAPATLPAASPPTSAGARSPLPELPTVEVTTRATHVVPDGDPPPARAVILRGRDGRDMTPRLSSASAVRAPPASAPAPSPPATFQGPARVGDATSLTLRGRAIALFGVRAATPGDRCASGANPVPRACSDVGRETLAARLSGNPTVSCRVPPGQRVSAMAAAICHDANGVDLGGLLVAEGFALADPGQSYDYVGAEGVARSLRRGLWRYR